MTENFPNLANGNIHTHEAARTPKKINLKKKPCEYILLLNLKKKKIQKSEKQSAKNDALPTDKDQHEGP